ncbi:MAG TPA: ABC transporter permease subunit [Aeromonadales bacterium]|nr:ABC transporter permease subunit [Aeromonadales bacterium]
MTQYIDRFGEQKIQHPVKVFWLSYENNAPALFGLLILSLLTLLMLLSPLLAPYSANRQFDNYILLPPSWFEGGTINYLLGTDELGRDLFSRLLIGGRTTLTSALIVVFVSSIVGVFLGLVTTFVGGWLNKLTAYIFDVLLTFPSFVMALLVIAIIGPGLTHSIFAVMLSLIPHFYKSIKNAITIEIKKPYYVAAKLDGASGFTLLFTVLLPNIISTIIIQISLSFSTAVLEIATLGFLGFGAQSLVAEWGAMLGDARSFSFQASWAVWTPGLAILVTVFAINLVGNGIRESLQSEQYH